jgi:uncharacterized protein (DUF2062 family)
MTALIIMLAQWRQGGWRMARRPSQSLPPAIEVALDHVVWLRLQNPRLRPYQAGAAIGATTYSWAQVVLAFAAAWEALPEDIRRGGNT